LGLPIRQLACGVYTTIALTSDGQVYTWEARKLGQAGYAPQLVEALQDKGVVKLACGLWDVMALTEDGEVYTWTDHSWSPFNSNKVIPSLVTALSGQGITDIVCGKAFSVALTDGGDVWSWPKGREDEAKPMEALRDKGVRMLACGDTHTVALATVGWRDECTVFTSGLNDYNQLGSVKDRTTDEPSAVDDLENMSFCQVACGGYHTVALTGPWMGLSSDLGDDLASLWPNGGLRVCGLRAILPRSQDHSRRSVQPSHPGRDRHHDSGRDERRHRRDLWSIPRVCVQGSLPRIESQWEGSVEPSGAIWSTPTGPSMPQRPIIDDIER
jgi:intracellular sulfur oxidation DsrE/DsrF family protein